MSFVNHTSKRMAVALVALFIFTVVLVAVAFTPPPAEAAGCTHGNTRWVKIGCCTCLHDTNKKLQSCNNGVWVDTGYTQCFWTGTCCSYPCCV